MWDMLSEKSQDYRSKKLAALAEALKEASLTKAQLGLELEELEAAARLVQEEESAGEATHSAFGQHMPSPRPEASDSEESDSTTSSEPEDSDPEQEVLKDGESETVRSLRGPFLEGSSALFFDDSGACRTSALPRADISLGKPLSSCQDPGLARPLIEEIGEHLGAAVQISNPEGHATGTHSSVQSGHAWQTPKDPL
ncbi:hypothetical protein MC885_007907 [Smutsia gigantea]|nr:hypothetical protein MC885_007907 [Smutsia gigantea]